MSWRLWVGFAALCLWSSLEWLVGDVLPVGMGSTAGSGLRFLMIGMVGLLFGRGDGWSLGKVAVLGLALVGGPYLLLDQARGVVSASLDVLAFALVPVGVMIVTGEMRLLPWGLAGVAGVLVLLPVALPETSRGFFGLSLLAGAACSTVCGLAGGRRLLRGVGLAGAVAGIGIGSGVLLMVVGTMSARTGWRWDAVGGEVVRALVVDLPELVLTVLLVRETSPSQVSARYLVAPLMTVLEGWFVAEARLGLRMTLGALLLAGGAYGLLRRHISSEEVALGLI